MYGRGGPPNNREKGDTSQGYVDNVGARRENEGAICEWRVHTCFAFMTRVSAFARAKQERSQFRCSITVPNRSGADSDSSLQSRITTFKF